MALKQKKIFLPLLGVRGSRIFEPFKKWWIFFPEILLKKFSQAATDRPIVRERTEFNPVFLNFRRFLMIVKKFGSSREEITSGCLVSRNSLSHDKELIKPVKNFCACAWQWTNELLNSFKLVGCESELVKLKTWFSSNVRKIELRSLNEDESNL